MHQPEHRDGYGVHHVAFGSRVPGPRRVRVGGHSKISAVQVMYILFDLDG